MQTGERRWFSVLGPVRARLGTVELDLGPPQQRAVLAVLLLAAGRPVPVPQLVDALWGSAPPASAGQAVRTYVSRLRQMLPTRGGPGDPVIESSPTGYRLLVADDELDLGVFHEHLKAAEAARRAGDPTGAAQSLRHGLALWSGEALAGLPGEQVRVRRDALSALRLDAQEALLAVEVDHGVAGAAVVELAGLVAAHPLDERFHRLLMLALHRSGRQAAALEAYENARQLLSNELGVEPGRPLQQLHLRILRADPALLATERELPTVDGSDQAAASAERGRRSVPAQLSADLSGFIGRSAEMARLEASLPGDGPLTTMSIRLIHGMAGTGKTTLALHWAHRIAHRFPDGQLQLNLRGFDASGSAMTPGEALRRLLDGLGVAPQRVPPEVDAQSMLLRSVLAGRRVLILLDNARGAEQVRPLLPGAGGCLVIVTSRHQLRSLVALDQAQPLALDVMAPSQARDYLVQRIGVQRIERDHERGDGSDEVAVIASLCDGLPLALSIVASRVVLEPEISLAGVARRLREDAGTLEAFSDSDGAIDLRTIFSWSYQQLDPEAARLLRALAQHPGPDTGLEVAASMAGLPLRRARACAGVLARGHLVREQQPGRFVLHDLVRAYAVERSTVEDAEQERAAVLERMLGHYVVWGRAAVRLLRPPYWHVVEVPAPTAIVVAADLGDVDSAQAWLLTEHDALTSVIEIAARAGLDRYVSQLAVLVGDLMRRYGYWQAALRVMNLAQAAGERLGDLRVQSLAHTRTGEILLRNGSPEEGLARLGRSSELLLMLDDARDQSLAFTALGLINLTTGDFPNAVITLGRALELASRPTTLLCLHIRSITSRGQRPTSVTTSRPWSTLRRRWICSWSWTNGTVRAMHCPRWGSVTPGWVTTIGRSSASNRPCRGSARSAIVSTSRLPWSTSGSPI